MLLNSFLKFIRISLLIFFTIVGVIFVGVFLAMQFGLFNLRGSVEDRNKFFTEIYQNQSLKDQTVEQQRLTILCESKAILKYNQSVANNIILVWDRKGDINITSGMINTAVLQIANTDPLIKNDISDCSNIASNLLPEKSIYPWVNTTDWDVISSGLIKDESTIDRVSKETNVPSRLIISAVIPEQFRFFSSNRESYKKYFEPLKILGTLTQFSLGISGIKPFTAGQIEKNDTDLTSEFYLGSTYEHILDYPQGVNHDTELYNRLTDPNNHYYQYLYTALFIKQIETQWLQAGFDISNRPDILSTIFNLGFSHSNPNDHPGAGGTLINVGGEEISFGKLGSEFYFSGELLDQFFY